MNGNCYVGFNSANRSYSVACDSPGMSAAVALARAGFPQIVYGPATWDACAAYMRQVGAPGW